MSAGVPTIPEIPACAAIRFGQVLIAGRRHGDCFRMGAALWLKKENSEQGFMTTRGNFVNRSAAFALAQAAGMESADAEGFRGTELFSEDLY